MSQRITCAACGTELPGGRGPCPECGGTRRAVALGVASEINVAESLSWKQSTPNTATQRRRAFESAVSDVETAADERQPRRAHDAVKAALEAIHELEDSRQRSEWAAAHWSLDELGLWHAHLGSRNAAHHSSAYVVHLVGGGDHTPSRDDLRWEDSLPPINSPKLASEYMRRLSGHAVLPTLREVSALLSRSIA